MEGVLSTGPTPSSFYVLSFSCSEMEKSCILSNKIKIMSLFSVYQRFLFLDKLGFKQYISDKLVKATALVLSKWNSVKDKCFITNKWTLNYRISRFPPQNIYRHKTHPDVACTYQTSPNKPKSKTVYNWNFKHFWQN